MTVMDAKYTLPNNSQLYAEWRVKVEQQRRVDMWSGRTSEPHQVLQKRRLMKLNWTTTCKLKNVQCSQNTVASSSTFNIL